MCIKVQIPSIICQNTLRPVCFSFVSLKTIGIVERSFLTSHTINYSRTSPFFTNLVVLHSMFNSNNPIQLPSIPYSIPIIRIKKLTHANQAWYRQCHPFSCPPFPYSIPIIRFKKLSHANQAQYRSKKLTHANQAQYRSCVKG